MEISAGLAIIHDNKILLAHPTGAKWFGSYSIPKGQVEENESFIQAAIRETKEELGIEFSMNQIDLNSEGYIDYTDDEGDIYKKVYFYTVNLNEPLFINRTHLQLEEIDWAGFLTKEDASKKIFWRLKPILSFLDESSK